MANNNKDRKQKAHKICSDFLQGSWKNVSVEDMNFSEIKGGLMNLLFHCALPDSASEKINIGKKDIPKEVLVRFYGPRQESQEVIVRELVICTMLSERNIGPKLYGVFADGRLEQYIPSKSTSTFRDFLDLYLDVAKEMAKFHSLQVPIKKTPSFKSDISEWLEGVKRDSAINVQDHSFCEIISSGEFEKEFTWLIKELEKIEAKVVFCHNDLQGGNILRLDNISENPKKRIKFIDYEFSAYNYRAFDVANYFLLKCIDFNPEERVDSIKFQIDKFPTKGEQEKFVDAYFDKLQEHNKEFESKFQNKQEKNKFLEEISLLKLGPCLYWTMIAFKVGFNPHNEYPYLEVVKLLWDFYKQLKEEFLRNK